MTPALQLASAKLVTVSKTTTGGAALMLTNIQSLDKDCSPLGKIDTKIITPPDHGTLSVTQGLAFPNYSPGDPPFMCNAKKSPATLLTYRAAPGYVGPDATSVQIFFPDGKAPTMLFKIDVK